MCGAGRSAGACIIGDDFLAIIGGEAGLIIGGEVLAIIVGFAGCIGDKGFLGKVAAILLSAWVASGWRSAT